MAARANRHGVQFQFSFLLTWILAVQGASQTQSQTPTLQYGSIVTGNGKDHPSVSSHPSPANGLGRSCNIVDLCRQIILSLTDTSGTRVETVVNVTMGKGALDGSVAGLEALAAGATHWFYNKTHSTGQLNFTMDPISDAANASTMLDLEAVSRGIFRAKPDMYAPTSTNDSNIAPRVVGYFVTKANSTSNVVELTFYAIDEVSVEEDDMKLVLKCAESILLAGKAYSCTSLKKCC
ncbi:hypothetical protein ES332_D10G257700v1 [Gossypium tomentosum]|uniref:Uncharacterized protein n=1 Tax=Gossypium tomentosum TaxID=34277 RepID=A0A5D2J8J5_GOSTO|nr:hypothetical protein ES332_D10G257700v1 [Gossypium tomentosum]